MKPRLGAVVYRVDHGEREEPENGREVDDHGAVRLVFEMLEKTEG